MWGGATAANQYEGGYLDRYDDGTGDFSRKKKDSFYYMQKVYKSNGEDLD